MKPLILVTNDDGITSAGLWAAVEAVAPLGEVLVVAPDRQWSGAGRSMPYAVTGKLTPMTRRVGEQEIAAFAVDASPALAVEHAFLELAPRRPDLVVSGINFGANVSIEVTISGTVGAALEAAAFGVPALAASLEMDGRYYLTGSEDADYSAARAYVQRFARQLLRQGMLPGVDVLNLNLPANATPETPWCYTRLSRRRYYEPLPPERVQGPARPGYRLIQDPHNAEMDSDIWVLMVAGYVSVTPLSLDLTAHAHYLALEETLTAELAAYQASSRLFALSPWGWGPKADVVALMREA